MIHVQVFSNTESAPASHPRAGHKGDVFELVLLSVRFDPAHFDVLAFARNVRTNERWSRHFTEEPDNRQVSRAVDWLLELVGGERSVEVLRAVAEPLEWVTLASSLAGELSLRQQVAAAVAACKGSP